MPADSLSRALLAEAQRLYAMVSDPERLQTEFPAESSHFESTFRNYTDEFRKRWHGSNGRGRILDARYLSLAADLRIATTILRGAVRYGNVATIEVKRAEIRECVRQLAGLIRDGVAGPPDEAERMGTVEALIH